MLLSDVGYMRYFWRKKGAEALGLQAHRHHCPAGLAATGRMLAGQQEPANAKDALFRARDWAGVAHLLEDEARTKKSRCAKEPRYEITSSLGELRASLNSPILRTGAIVDQLVDVWALAKEVDPEAARPAEALLCAMEGCALVSAGQVSSACDQVEAALTRPDGSR